MDLPIQHSAIWNNGPFKITKPGPNLAETYPKQKRSMLLTA